MTPEEKAKRYEEALEIARKELQVCGSTDCDAARQIFRLFPELQESEDERIIEWIIEDIRYTMNNETLENSEYKKEAEKAIAWLEKQKNIDVLDKEKREFADNVDSYRKEIDEFYKGYNVGKEAEKQYWLKKQSEQKSVSKEYTFKSIPRLLDMIEPTDRSKSYCKKLIDSLQTEGYSIDAKIVGECLKQMNGEKVSMATMDDQNPADKVEPKFHEGDWITCDELNTALIINIDDDDKYEVKFIDGNKGFPHIDYIDRLFHLWTVKDAKDGDMLVTVNDKRPFIYKGCLDPNHPDSPVAYCGIDSEGYFCKGGDKFDHWWTDEKVHPATKEQRDLLFSKMRESGYEFDFEKKELKKLSQRMISAEAKEALYDKPTDEEMKELLRTEYEKGRADTIAEMKSSWSEEDEHLSYWTIHNLTELKNRFGDNYGDSGKCIDWLKQLKQRIGG